MGEITPKHSRRRFQYSLGTMFAIATIAAIIAGSVAWSVRNGLLPEKVAVQDERLVIHWQDKFVIVDNPSVTIDRKAILLVSAGVAGTLLITRFVIRRTIRRRNDRSNVAK